MEVAAAAAGAVQTERADAAHRTLGPGWHWVVSFWTLHHLQEAKQHRGQMLGIWQMFPVNICISFTLTSKFHVLISTWTEKLQHIEKTGA